MSNSNMMNEYLQGITKLLSNNQEQKDSNLDNLDKDKLMESFMQFQNYMKSQQTGIPVQQNPGSMSTSNGSDGFGRVNKSSKLDDTKEADYAIEEKNILTFQNNDNVKNIDDIPIIPKSNNFMDLLNKQLENASDPGEFHEPIKKVNYQPRRKRSDLINISKPTEAKKYKYYSQNFNKNFGKDNVEEVEPQVFEKVKSKYSQPSVASRPRSVKETIQTRDQRMRE
jgi:hypothetical protein